MLLLHSHSVFLPPSSVLGLLSSSSLVSPIDLISGCTGWDSDEIDTSSILSLVRVWVIAEEELDWLASDYGFLVFCRRRVLISRVRSFYALGELGLVGGYDFFIYISFSNTCPFQLQRKKDLYLHTLRLFVATLWWYYSSDATGAYLSGFYALLYNTLFSFLGCSWLLEPALVGFLGWSWELCPLAICLGIAWFC